MSDDLCSHCHNARLVGWSGAGPILCPTCSRDKDPFHVITEAWREQRGRVRELEAQLSPHVLETLRLAEAVRVAHKADPYQEKRGDDPTSRYVCERELILHVLGLRRPRERIMHMSMAIDYALTHALGDFMVGGERVDPEKAKRYLQAKQAQGHKMIPMSNECEGFDPVKGCPGHEKEETR